MIHIGNHHDLSYLSLVHLSFIACGIRVDACRRTVEGLHCFVIHALISSDFSSFGPNSLHYWDKESKRFIRKFDGCFEAATASAPPTDRMAHRQIRFLHHKRKGNYIFHVGNQSWSSSLHLHYGTFLVGERSRTDRS
jgi:hypothetical protein